MIKVKNLHKYYNNLHVLKGIDLEVNRGEAVVIQGEAKSGKSTLIRCLNFSESIDEGQIWFDGKKIHQEDFDNNNVRKNIGIVLQHTNLFPHKTVMENIIEAPIILQRMSQEKAFAKGMTLLKKVGLEDKTYIYPEKLSSGEKQRIAIARALVMNPKLILFDEPTANIPTEESKEIWSVLKRIEKDRQTIVVTTNDMAIVHKFYNRILYLENGIIVQRKIV